MTLTQRHNSTAWLEGLKHYRSQQLQLVRQRRLLSYDLGVEGVEARGL
jgi:hypothetical protein